MELKYQNWIPVRSPGLRYYAGRIIANDPFSLVRYGEGEWRVVVPEMHVKKQRVFSEWHTEEAQDAMRETLLGYHQDERYLPAIWHQRYYAKNGRLRKIQRWLTENELGDIPWHDGRLFRRATERDRVHVIVEAIRECPLPLVIVGPGRIEEKMREKFKIERFISIHPTHAYNHRGKTVGEILKIDTPSLVSFSAGGTANILIHRLFPFIGEESFLIDFGALWEGLAGKRTRPYHRSLSPARIKKNWEGA